MTDRQAHQYDALDSLMEFDHVIRVQHGVADDDGIPHFAPEIMIDCDDDEVGSILKEHEDAFRAALQAEGWELMDGYSGQQGYRGPIMHSSEYIGGRMAEDILANDGYYVAIVVESDADTTNYPVAGWAVAYRPLINDGATS